MSNTCSTYGAHVGRRLARSDIVTMRRALGMAPDLPGEQVRWLLDESERLLQEREELERALARLSEPWTGVRAALNEVAAILRRA